MGIGQKLKGALGSDSKGRNYDDYDTPGQHPLDGTRYEPPTGTAVGHSDMKTTTDPHDERAEGMMDRDREALSGNHGQQGRRVDDRYVMDPADTKRGSNVMDTTGRAGDPVTSGTGVGNDRDYDHHNQLHRNDDPRRYESTDVGNRTGLGSSGIPERRPVGGHDTTGYGRDSSRTYDNEPVSATSHGQNHGQNHGIYNTVTGRGSHDEPRRDHQSGHHDKRDVYESRMTETGLGQQDMAYRTRDSGHDQHGSGHGAGLGTGVTGLAANQTAQHHTGQYGQHGDLSRSTMNPTGNVTGRAGHDAYDTQPIGTSGHMSGTAVPGSREYDANQGTGSHALGQDSIRSQAQQPGLASGLAPGIGQALGSHPSQGHNVPGRGVLHHGPGHENAKVMHTCTHCGRDNDISQYFRKEAVYRLG